MHTATQLDRSMFSIEVDGAPAEADGVFPGWHPYDRLGVVVQEPLGAVGASMLIQLAIVLFYDARPERRNGRAHYPDVYLFHVGGWHGDHSAYDFWPERKEVCVAQDAVAVLDAINDRAITRLAVPEGPATPVEHRWKETESAMDRVRSAFVYSPVGRTSEADVTIGGTDPRTEANPRMALDPERVLRLIKSASGGADRAAKETDRMYAPRVRARLAEVAPSVRGEVSRRRERLLVDGLATETYRRIDVGAALERLVR